VPQSSETAGPPNDDGGEKTRDHQGMPLETNTWPTIFKMNSLRNNLLPQSILLRNNGNPTAKLTPDIEKLDMSFIRENNRFKYGEIHKKK
jgi:hypothetical protein